MKRRDFIKLSGISSLLSLFPFNLSAKGGIKIDDICTQYPTNDSIFTFKENEFTKRILNGLKNNGSIKPDNKFEYYLGFHHNILPYKDTYTVTEINDFIDEFIIQSYSVGFPEKYGNNKYPFTLFLEKKYIWENGILLKKQLIGYRFEGLCCHKK